MTIIFAINRNRFNNPSEIQLILKQPESLKKQIEVRINITMTENSPAIQIVTGWISGNRVVCCFRP
jgi:hypothetical protein